MARPHNVVDLGSLPRDPDRDSALVDVRRPDRQREEIVLADQVRSNLDRVEAEYRVSESLLRQGVAPKTRLLFVGPPGCGKTLCAEILASDLGLPLLYARFDGIVSSYLGETSSNLRRVFQFAASHPSVLFFDEFDVLGKRRDDDHEVGELKRVVGSFLQILDAHPRNRIVIAATNHQGLLDEALWRRFDEVLPFTRPDTAGLTRLLELRLAAVRKKGVDLPGLASRMEGFSYADAERVCHEAIKAMILGAKRELTQDLLEQELAEQHRRLSLAAGLRPQGG